MLGRGLQNPAIRTPLPVKTSRSAAFDIAMSNHNHVAIEAVARKVGFLGFGFYRRSGFTQVDFGPARQWGRAVPGPGDCLRRGNATSARGSG